MARFFPHFRLANAIGLHEVEWDVTDIRELLETGRRQFGEVFEAELKGATILVNGRAISYLGGFKTPLGSGDEVWSVLPSAGG